jgi:nucleotidyltransferase substrate binding protein (TIGR01987 family)
LTVNPPQDRLALALAQFGRALARLKEVLERTEDDVVRDAIIQRFEFTFEMAWKAMYRLLRSRGLDVNESAFEVIPLAFTHALITDAAGWGDLRKYRNLTSHSYDEKVAIEVAAFVRTESVGLFDALADTLARQHRAA